MAENFAVYDGHQWTLSGWGFRHNTCGPHTICQSLEPRDGVALALFSAMVLATALVKVEVKDAAADRAAAANASAWLSFLSSGVVITICEAEFARVLKTNVVCHGSKAGVAIIAPFGCGF